MARPATFGVKEFNTENAPTGSGQAPRTEKGKNCTGLSTRSGQVPTRHYEKQRGALAGEAVFLRIEQLGEARVFLEESEILVVARVITIFRTQLNADLQICQARLCSARDAVHAT